MNEIKKFFPIFLENSNLVYLDSGASAQKPLCVIEKMNDFYKKNYANIHRGLYPLSENVTQIYEDVRLKIAEFIGASFSSEIIFTKGTTESINLVASSFSSFLNKDDEIIISEIEHHSNMLPWRNLEKIKGVKIKYLPIVEDGNFDYEWLRLNVSEKTKIVCVSGQSNVIGIKNDINKIVNIAHNVGAKVLVDGAQLTVHSKVDVKNLGVDFYVFSAHKIYGPTGIGILYGKKEILDEMPPYQFGGDMVDVVSLDNIVYKEVPFKFEAGTPPIVEVIGLGQAIDFLNEFGMDFIEKKGKELTEYAFEKLSMIDGIRIISSKNSNSIISFIVNGVSSFDIGMMLGQSNICVRVGKHCAEPLHNHFGIENSIRVSIGIYNDKCDIDKFIMKLKQILLLLR